MSHPQGLPPVTRSARRDLESLGILAPDGESLSWPGSDVFLIVLLVGWFAFSRLLVEMLRRPAEPDPVTVAPATMQPTRAEA